MAPRPHTFTFGEVVNAWILELCWFYVGVASLARAELPQARPAHANIFRKSTVNIS